MGSLVEGTDLLEFGVWTMAKKKTKKKAVKRKPATKRPARKKTPKKKTAKRRERAETEPTEMPGGRRGLKPFDVCNYYGVYLREIFEKEHLRDHKAKLGNVFDCLVSDLRGAWNMVKLYGKDTPLQKLRGEGNPFHHDK